MNKYICCFMCLLSSLLGVNAKEIALLTPLTSSGEKIIESLEKEYNKNNSSLTKNNNSSLVSYVDVDSLENSDISYIDLNSIDAKKSNEYKEHLRDFILEEDKIAIVDQTTISTDNKEEKSKIMSKIFGVGATGEVVVVSLGDDGVLTLNTFLDSKTSSDNQKSENKTDTYSILMNKHKNDSMLSRVAKLVSSLAQRDINSSYALLSQDDDDDVLTEPYVRLDVTRSTYFSIPTNSEDDNIPGDHLFNNKENERFGNLEYLHMVWEIFLGVTGDDEDENFAVMVSNKGVGFLATPVYQKSWGWGTWFFDKGHTIYLGYYKDLMSLGVSLILSESMMDKTITYDYNPKNIVEGGSISNSTSIGLHVGFERGAVTGLAVKNWADSFSYDIDMFKMTSKYNHDERKLWWDYDLNYLLNGRKYNDPKDMTNWNYDGCNYDIGDGISGLPTIATQTFIPQVAGIFLIPTTIQESEKLIGLQLETNTRIVKKVFGYNRQMVCILTTPSRYHYKRQDINSVEGVYIDTSDLIIPE